MTSYINCFLQIGAFHTLEIELQRPFVLRKVIVMIPVITVSYVFALCRCELDRLLGYIVLVRLMEVVFENGIGIWGGF